MCDFCQHAENLEIKEAHNNLGNINEHVQLFIDGGTSDKFIAFDIETTEVSNGYYIDINYCPICGDKL